MKSSTTKKSGLVKKLKTNGNGAKDAAKAVKTPTKAQPNLANPVELKEASFTVKPSNRRKIRKTKVFMEGKLTIHNVDQFKNSVLPVFDAYDYVDFYLKEVVELDLSYIQLLSYFKNCYGPANDKNVTVDAELPNALKKVVVKAGFMDLMFIPKLV